jgi:hypothetical protein
MEQRNGHNNEKKQLNCFEASLDALASHPGK